MKTLTDKQRAVLDYIVEYRAEYKYSPVTREIAEHFGMSIKGAYDHVVALRKKGAITMGDRVSRSIVPVEGDT